MAHKSLEKPRLLAAHRVGRHRRRPVPAMLQTVLGLDAARIVACFLVSGATMGQRLVRAKRKIRTTRIAFAVPIRTTRTPASAACCRRCTPLMARHGKMSTSRRQACRPGVRGDLARPPARAVPAARSVGDRADGAAAADASLRSAAGGAARRRGAPRFAASAGGVAVVARHDLGGRGAAVGRANRIARALPD